MQYLTNQQGEPLGVFLTMDEWDSFRQQTDMPYEEWERTRFAGLGTTLG